MNDKKSSLVHKQFIVAISVESEPSKFFDALKHSHWRQAMQSEVDALERNQTWTLTTFPLGKKALGCKWIYKIKRKFNSNIEQYKACLVILGNMQVEGLDYHDTFALVAKIVTVRTLLAVAAARNWELH